MPYQPTADDHAILIDNNLYKLKNFPALNLCQRAEVASEVTRLLEYLKEELYRFEDMALEAERKNQVGGVSVEDNYMPRHPTPIVDAELQHYQGTD